MPNEKTPQTLKGKTALWGSLAVAFVVAVLLVFLLVTPNKSAEPAAQPEPVTSESAAAQGKCNVPVGDTSSKPVMPKDLRWEAKDGWTWPVSDTYGPTQTKDGFGVCFARSPLGAALAAVTINASGNAINARKAGELYGIPGIGLDLAMKDSPDGPVGGDPSTYAGFIVDSFTKDETSITTVYATAASSTGYIGFPLTLKWIDGDWKLKTLDDGSSYVGQAPSPAKGAFVEWRGSNGM